jgi:hypothetical protein
MSDEIEQIYGFTYTDCEGKEYSKTIKTPGATWRECLNDYVRFLESIFQYDIMSQVRLKDDEVRRGLLERYPYDYIDPWQGEYFVDEDEEDANSSNPGLSD